MCCQLLGLLQAATLEVRLLHRQGETVLVQLTNTTSYRYRNVAILAYLVGDLELALLALWVGL